ncbi:uncharacterized protein LOC136087874 [Hydra vulgaris]|uniref:Uncharacterized protein LOC136087874 n=1 Tax=Hydra vulgaris TaxID=6087 RepID=A0ABM4D006_HYDVU
MTTSQVFNYDEPMKDVGIKRCHYYAYNPIIGTNLNSGDIRIIIDQTDLYTLPCKAYILVEGTLLKNDGTAYANTDVIFLINNGIMYLFDRISYKLSSTDVETIDNPGVATTMLGLLKYSNNFQVSKGLNQLWYKDFSTTASLTDNVGFAIRGSDNNAIFRANNVVAGKVVLDKVALYIPQLDPSFEQESKLLSMISSKVTIQSAYRGRRLNSMAVPQTTSFNWQLGPKASSERPRYVIVGFQTNKLLDQTTNPSLFDHCDLQNMQFVVSNKSYPELNYNLSFPNMKYSLAYGTASDFSEKFYGTSDLITNGNILYTEYRDLFPIMVFDVSNQRERLDSSIVNTSINATFNTAVPANTMAYALVISDKLLNFQSDGNRLTQIH